MKTLNSFPLTANAKTPWHRGPGGCSYRFEYTGKPGGFSVEWEGNRPPIRAKGFWKRYAARRDTFVADATPAGLKVLVACAFTCTVREIEGRAAGCN